MWRAQKTKESKPLLQTVTAMTGGDGGTLPWCPCNLFPSHSAHSGGANPTVMISRRSNMVSSRAHTWMRYKDTLWCVMWGTLTALQALQPLRFLQ